MIKKRRLLSINSLCERATRRSMFLAVLLILEVIATPSSSVYSADLCKTADPTIFSDVFKCMASAKHRNSQTNMFENNIRTSNCQSISMQYLNILTKQGFTRQEAENRLPSCEIFAKAAEDICRRSFLFSPKMCSTTRFRTYKGSGQLYA